MIWSLEQPDIYCILSKLLIANVLCDVKSEIAAAVRKEKTTDFNVLVILQLTLAILLNIFYPNKGPMKGKYSLKNNAVL